MLNILDVGFVMKGNQYKGIKVEVRINFSLNGSQVKKYYLFKGIYSFQELVF